MRRVQITVKSPMLTLIVMNKWNIPTTPKIPTPQTYNDHYIELKIISDGYNKTYLIGPYDSIISADSGVKLLQYLETEQQRCEQRD